MALELGHEALAETHDLGVALAVGIKVAAALAAAHGQAGQAVLKGLLEAEELHNGKIYVRSKAQTSLVGADGAVELHAEAAVDIDLTGVIHPGYAELYHTLGLNKALKQTGLLVFGMLIDNGLKGLEDLFNGLKEFRLVLVALFNLLQDFLNVRVHCSTSKYNNAFFVMRAAQFGFTPRIKLIINLRYTNVKLIVCL